MGFRHLVRLCSVLALPALCTISTSSAWGADAANYVSTQDEVDPASLLPFWTKDLIVSFGPPYMLTAKQRENYAGVFGVDLSHYNFDLSNSEACKSFDGYAKPECSCSADWSVLTKNKIKFVYTKASDGAGHDLSFPVVWKGVENLHEAGTLSRGAYHFLRPDVSAEIQADTYLKSIGAVNGATPKMLPPVLDIEWSNKHVIPGTRQFDSCTRKTKNDEGQYYCDMWYKVQPTQIAALASRWSDIVSKATGRPVILYTNVKAWWNPVMGAVGDKLAAAHAIWLSRYTSLGPSYDPSWTEEGGSPKWKMPPLPHGRSYSQTQYDVAHFWQFSEKAMVTEPLFVCHGQAKDRNFDMDWVPISEADFPTLFGVAPQ